MSSVPIPVQIISGRPPGAPPPRVSIKMITYKHERFIAQAIESVMMQQTSFDFELVIGEDCSPDRTREICLVLQRKYPDRIRLLLPEKNIGMMPNSFQTFRACDGQYIALLEGDDFWTSPHKLQKQVDFLEANPQCSSCFHPVNRVLEGTSGEPQIDGLSRHKAFYSLADVIARQSVPTCSVLFRNYFKQGFPDWFYKMGFGDWGLHILCAEQGSLAYLDEVMATYRVHPGGIWSTTTRIWQLEQMVYLYQSLDHYLHPRHRRLVRQCLSRRAYQLSVQYFSAGRSSDARHAAWMSVKSSPLNPAVSLPKRGKQLAISTLPVLSRVWAGLKKSTA